MEDVKQAWEKKKYKGIIDHKNKVGKNKSPLFLCNSLVMVLE